MGGREEEEGETWRSAEASRWMRTVPRAEEEGLACEGKETKREIIEGEHTIFSSVEAEC